MVIERISATMSWRVSEGGWRFEIVDEIARGLYSDHLRWCVDRDRLRSATMVDDTPLSISAYLPPQLPTWEDFLKMLAYDRWERMLKSRRVSQEEPEGERTPSMPQETEG